MPTQLRRWALSQHGRFGPYHLAHSKESTEQPNNYSIARQKLPNPMPSQMRSKDDSEGKKIEAAQQYARWLLLHEENTFGVHYRQSSCHPYQRGRKKRMPWHNHCQLEQVFDPFLARLGMWTFGRGWEKSRPHQKTPPLDRLLVLHVPPWHTGHTRHALWGTSIVIAGDHWPSRGPTRRCMPAIYDERCHTWWRHGQISWRNGLNLDAFIMINYHEKD